MQNRIEDVFRKLVDNCGSRPSQTQKVFDSGGYPWFAHGQWVRAEYIITYQLWILSSSHAVRLKANAIESLHCRDLLVSPTFQICYWLRTAGKNGKAETRGWNFLVSNDTPS